MKELFIPTKKNKYKPYLLKKVSLFFYAIILVVVNTFGGFIGISEISASNITPSNIIALTNQERSAAGLNTLNQNAKLAAAAQAKAENMFEEQYWDHFGPNGESPWQFITAAGYNYVYAGENLAKGFRTAEGVVEAWMASPTHRDNILSGNYKDIGVAIMTGVLNGSETILVVQMFGNLTSQVYTPKPVSETETPTETTKPNPVTKSPVIESGQIKAISITHPKAGDILKDSSILIKGEVEGDREEYTVELYDLDKKITELDSNGDKWEFSSEDNWEEGSHELKARVKEDDVVSSKTPFGIDVTPPTVERESISIVNSENNYTIGFDIDEEWKEITVTSGEQEVTFVREETDEIVLQNFIPSESVVLSITDQAGNSTELDISEYFVEGDTEDYNNFNFTLLINSLKSRDGVNVLIVAFIILLMLIEVYILSRKGKLGQSLGDLFVIGLWITILTIGVFKGFGGVAI
jgi:hypothetical protein